MPSYNVGQKADISLLLCFFWREHMQTDKKIIPITLSQENFNTPVKQQPLNLPFAADIIKRMSEQDLLHIIEMNKKLKHEQDLLQAHLDNFYNIWLGKNGLYTTYLPAPGKSRGRRAVTAQTREKLERKIIDFYLEQERQEKEDAEKAALSTLRKIYPHWLEMKTLETAATSYIRRIDVDWHKYYLNSPIIDKCIKDFTRAELKRWALQMIREYSLSKNRYYNMAIIIRQCLDYAVEQEIISENPYNSFRIDGKLFQKRKKPEDNTQVFLTDERPLIEAEAWKDFEKTGCTTALAIPLAFQTGMRLGELVALKSTDVCNDGKYLHIQRMRQKVEKQLPDGRWKSCEWQMADHTKTSAGDRYLYLTEEARRIIAIVIERNKETHSEYDDFLFLKEGKNITPRAVATRIDKYCRHANISSKSMHKIRKTYISSLLDVGININEIRKQVGHEDERTTLHNYCFNRSTDEQTEAALEKALAG